MRKIFKILVLLYSCFSFSQEKNLNVVLFVNDELLENISDIQISGDSVDLWYPSQYCIGDLKISSDDYFKLNNSNSKAIYFKINVFENKKRGFEKKDFLIKLDKTFLNKKYIVIRIYDLDSKMYRKKLKNKSIKYGYNVYTDGIYSLNI